MKKCFAVLLTLVLLLISFVLFFSKDQDSTAMQTKTVQETQSPQITDSVPPETQLGQLFMIGHWANTPIASTTALIEKYQPGGVIIMSAPEDTNEIKQWIAQWNQVSEIPLIISIDQEGGPVSRLKSESFVQTGQRDITSTETAYAVGLKRGEELASLGITMNFAPVLDVAHKSDSFMYQRTFPDTTNADALAGALMEGMTAANVTPVIKHFPGHDDTNDDSHFTLPVVAITRSQLDTFTSLFRSVITQNNPRVIMTAHVQFPNIDILPATLSPFFLQSYLREELNYNGLIITDDMTMDAIAAHYQTNTASQMAIEAGADIILFAAEPTMIEDVIPFLIEQHDASPQLAARISDSYQRITAFKNVIE